jgi:predicted deacylase
VVNEPAYLRGHRTADDALDLARVCPGRPDGSITERVAHELAGLIRSADYYIDLHTGGTRLCVHPLTGYMMHEDETVLAAQRRMARAFNLPIVWGTSAALNGRSLSVARDAGVPAIYCEYLGSATCSPAGIDAYVEGCQNVMAALEMIDRPAPPSNVEHVVEDVRENSGHMQICNPAPLTGFFEPWVQLGDRVRFGQRLGCVTDVLERHSASIGSRQEGIVIVLNTFSRVEEGDSLMVILDLPP